MTAIRDSLTPTIIQNTDAFDALKQRHVFGEFLPATVRHAWELVQDSIQAVYYAPREAYDSWLPGHLSQMLLALEAHNTRHSHDLGWCACPKRWEIELDEVFLDAEIVSGTGHTVAMAYAWADDNWIFERLSFPESSLESLRHEGRLMGLYVRRSITTCR